MMPWQHEFVRESRSASEPTRTSANFRLWVGLIAYCVFNLLCWGLAWGNYRAAIFVGLAWSFAVPSAAAVALLVFKLKSQKALFTWGAFTAAVLTLVVSGLANLALLQEIVDGV